MVLCIIHREGGLTLQLMKRVKRDLNSTPAMSAASSEHVGVYFIVIMTLVAKAFSSSFPFHYFHSPLQCLLKHCVCFPLRCTAASSCCYANMFLEG